MSVATLSHAQGTAVLRYWLAGVRLEEALKTRPRARNTRHASPIPRCDLPSSGQDYFKLTLAGEVAPLLAGVEPPTRPFDGELAAFFEDWLTKQYRRSQDENELPHLLCFPVVHLPRGELAGLLRCPVRLAFSADDAAFRAPSRSERQRAMFPPPPNQLRVARAPVNEATLPFFVDTRLLSYPLGLSSEEIDSLFERLRAREVWTETEMLTLVCEVLEQALVASELRAAAESTGVQLEPAQLLERLTRAMRALLLRSPSRAEVYPVGIVIDGSQAKTTWHLQRELTGLLEARGKDAWSLASSLGAYLTHQPLPSAEQPQRALFTGPPLTHHQRAAAEHFWGSTFSSVQGPPGTGKTTLILHLCAEAIVRQVEGLAQRKAMSCDLFLIASGNNRAVDNVVDPLCAGDLPLALRVGSRQVCEHVLLPALRRTLAWLTHALSEPVVVHQGALDAALAQFVEVREQLEQVLGPRQRALANKAERARLTTAIAELPPMQRTRADASLSVDDARAVENVLGPVEQRISALSQLCSKQPSMVQVNTIARHFGKTAQSTLPALEHTLSEVGLSLDLPLPPLVTPLDVAALMEEWEEGAELLLTRLAALRDRITPVLKAEGEVHRAKELAAQLAALGPVQTVPVAAHDDALSHALYCAAVAVREAWAKHNARPLSDALRAALEFVEQERSLRGLFRHEPEHARWLCRLFPVWGSTLLSLGNCLPADADSAARVVIDEAGQCHPAHVVSALMRASSALVIGDVYQLPPVIDLSPEDDARLVRSVRLEIDALRLAPFRLGTDSQVSAQSLAERAVAERHVLVDHFRCQPEIIAISDALCHYGLVVHTRPARRPALLDHAVAMRDLRGEQQRLHGSLWNKLELDETLALTSRLLARGARPEDIAIITPYRGQLDCLRRGLQELRIPLEFSPELLDSEQASSRAGAGLALGTVHRFQGGERNIVLLSCVVTRVSSLGFLNSRPNLLNVAVSRAQQHLVCLGDRSVLMEGRYTRLLTSAAVQL